MVKDKEIKAQAFDCMQYFYGAVQEPRIRCYIKFQSRINESTLNRAVNLSLGAIPILGCIFDKKHHCWKDCAFTADDIIRVIEVSKGDESTALKLLLTNIDISREPQLKILIIREEKHDTLCIIINHMVSDGAGFKEYLYLLCDLYSKCDKYSDYNTKPKPLGRRNLNQLLQNFSCKEKLKILFSKSSHNIPDSAMIMPIKGDSTNPLIVITRLEKDQFCTIRNFAKEMGASINDILLTAYIRVLHRVTRCGEITVPCPVDLRKYKSKNQQCGICNLTSNYFCSVEIPIDETFEETLQKVSVQMRIQKESDTCLKGPMLFHIIFHTLAIQTVQKIFYKTSPVPVTSYTNLGIIDDAKFNFGNTTIDDAFISTAVKKAPYFQLSVSTYQGLCTLTSSFYGTENDRNIINDFLTQIKNELTSLSNKGSKIGQDM